MSTTTRRQCIILFLICNLFLAAAEITNGFGSANTAEAGDTIQAHGRLHLEIGGRKIKRRIGIGSIAPMCTYNECRGCKYKCRAEQVPVDGNDPINSPYHYKCVCHRS